jgi:drug/metabolite transporter (DMT)-like permease
MRLADSIRLVSLAAIWGASFLFMRIAAPTLGPVLTAELRSMIAGVALAAYFLVTGYDPEYRRWARHYVIVGILSSAVPFLLWAYAALSLTAGMLSVLNATAPMWGAVCSAVILGERLNARRVAGLVVGVAGVALVTRPGSSETFSALAVGAAVVATFCYGLIATYIKRWANDVPSRGMAAGSQLAAGTLLIPFIALWMPAGPATPGVVGAILALGLVCSALAYLLYFRLIADLGATGALTVTYLLPVFGVLWGVLFLGETLSLQMIAGGALVVVGTILVLRQ